MKKTKFKMHDTEFGSHEELKQDIKETENITCFDKNDSEKGKHSCCIPKKESKNEKSYR